MGRAIYALAVASALSVFIGAACGGGEGRNNNAVKTAGGRRTARVGGRQSI